MIGGIHISQEGTGLPSMSSPPASSVRSPGFNNIDVYSQQQSNLSRNLQLKLEEKTLEKEAVERLVLI